MYLLTYENKFELAADKLNEQTICVTAKVNDLWKGYLITKNITPHCRKLKEVFYYSSVPFK